MGLTLRDLEISYSLAQEANDIEHRLERLKAYATRCSGSVAGNPLPTGDASDKVGDGVAAYLDLEREGKRKIAFFLTHAKIVEDAIDELSNTVHKTFLRKRYIDGLKMQDIEAEMCYSRRQLERIHKKALTSLGIDKDVAQCRIDP